VVIRYRVVAVALLLLAVVCAVEAHETFGGPSLVWGLLFGAPTGWQAVAYWRRRRPATPQQPAAGRHRT
jgi:hypothetical protein